MSTLPGRVVRAKSDVVRIGLPIRAAESFHGDHRGPAGMLDAPISLRDRAAPGDGYRTDTDVNLSSCREN